MSKRMNRSLVATVAILLLVGGGAAAASTPPDDAGALPVVEVTLDDFSFTMPDTLPAGAVRIEATNVGAEDHEVSFARVIDGATVADVAAADEGATARRTPCSTSMAGRPKCAQARPRRSRSSCRRARTWCST